MDYIPKISYNIPQRAPQERPFDHHCNAYFKSDRLPLTFDRFSGTQLLYRLCPPLRG